MVIRLPYVPTDDPPHMPAEYLERRLAGILCRQDGAGHRIWQGAMNNGDGVLRVRAPEATTTISVRRCVWWLQHREWLGHDHFLQVTCGQPRCAAIGHLAKRTRATVLSDEQVAEAKALYFAGRPTADIDGTPRRSALQMASFQLGLAKETIKRVLAAKKVVPKAWMTQEVDVAMVRRVYAEKLAVAQERQARTDGRWTMQALARHFCVSQERMSLLIDAPRYKQRQRRKPSPWAAPPPPPKRR